MRRTLLLGSGLLLALISRSATKPEPLGSGATRYAPDVVATQTRPPGSTSRSFTTTSRRKASREPSARVGVSVNCGKPRAGSDENTEPG